MVGSKTLAIGLLVLLFLGTFKKFAVIILGILLILWLIRLGADVYHHFKGDDFW